MKQTSEQVELLVWCDAARVGLVADVVSRLPRIKPVALGGPTRAPLGELAAQFGLASLDDLRKTLIEKPTPWVLLAVGEGVGAAEQKILLQNKSKVLCLEPVVPVEPPGSPTFESWLAPALTSCPAWLSAAEPLQMLEPIRTLQWTATCPRGVATLYARLFEAMQAMTHWLGVPQTVDASLAAGPVDLPEAPQSLAGDLTAHVRFNAQASAVLHLSDRLHTWDRRIRIYGDKCHLLLNDTAYKLNDAHGHPMDVLKGPTRPADPADLIARQWKRILQGAAVESPTADPRVVHACCQAVLLSCRTRQAESPATLMRIRT